MADAIFTHDSAWMTAGVGEWANNPGNLRCMGDKSPYKHECVQSPGNGYFAKFQNEKDGIAANVELLARKYAGKTPENIVWTWARTQNESYYHSVKNCFTI